MEERRTDWRDLVVETPRLRLTALGEEHFEAEVALHGDPDVVRWLPREVRDRDAVRDCFVKARAMRLVEEGDALVLAGELVPGGGFVGEFILILRSLEHRGVEIGYVVAPAYAGRGLATEGAQALLRVAFDLVGAHRVVGRIYAEHHASARVLTKVGMRREAYLVSNERHRGVWTDEVDFAILEDEWRSGDAEAGTRAGD